KCHNYSPKIRNLLYSIQLAEKYQLNVNEESHKIIRNKIRDRYFPDITVDGLVDLPDGITETRDGVITFISDHTRHDVMYAFVTECLVEDSDLEFFLTTASRDVISEYCRSWRYERSEGERCLYVPDIPEKMYDLFIDKLKLDIITHCTMSDVGIHDRISGRLGVPLEVLRWDQEARERYVEYAKRGTQTVHHARGMIVGCAGAGKTTLLKRLLRCSEEEIKEVKSTEGLEVHEEIFELCDKTKSLKARRKFDDQKNVENNSKNLDSRTLTFFDFGGQCAYYACHQIYLTRRAFYVVVVDASKPLDQKVDKEVCDQDGSIFSGWTYGDYFEFWIKSIHTYCGSDNEKDTKPVVLIVATHWEEENRQFKDKEAFMESLQRQIPQTSNLSQYVKKGTCYCTQLSESINEFERCLFEIACQQHWKESIPKEWLLFELEINQEKHKKRIINVSEITSKGPDNSQVEKKNMLRYYHDAGKALYFNETGLDDKVIIDVQWFIGAFKHIITDKLHFEGFPVNLKDWNEYYRTGNLGDKLLEEIWKHKDELLSVKPKLKVFDILFMPAKNKLLDHKESLLHFTQRLGLLAVGKDNHYVPCMNRKEMEDEIPNFLKGAENKSSVLIYCFGFLPYFMFFRLVVACMQEKDWKVLFSKGTSCLYKDAALFSYMDYRIVLSVTKESIQLQVIPSMPDSILQTDKTQKIQDTVENMLNNFAGKFHRKLYFVRGFRCRVENENPIAMDILDHFLPEKDIPKDIQKMDCPLHPFTDPHTIDISELVRYWKM
ncbi:probable serine/threonine-protein kinase pats1, partial [Saccostrea cucullata]|uniref:probable serine/threonine-protein kinase pats1 n=1 Tax=Saccostrea cuccullata TaxID=36930 RepID=UPI002ED15438